MTIRFASACTACVTFFLSATAGAATASIAGLQESWLISALVALLCAAVMLGLYALVERRRRTKALAAVVVGARERSLQRHTERQRLATQFSEADF
jgi:hypothetical protein